MLSKTSFCEYFNRTLFRKNMMRFWPLWAAPSFIGALIPLAYLTQLLRWSDRDLLSALNLTSAYYEVIAYALPILSLCYAVLVALAVWSYLFNSRSTGMMHTLPIRREGLFLTGVLSGLTMMLIPYVVTGGTDARFFGEVCDNCVRFSPVNCGPEQMAGMHGLNENIESGCLPGAVDYYKTVVHAQEVRRK